MIQKTEKRITFERKELFLTVILQYTYIFVSMVPTQILAIITIKCDVVTIIFDIITIQCNVGIIHFLYILNLFKLKNSGYQVM